jgi:multiple sugar transport system permease protein
MTQLEATSPFPKSPAAVSPEVVRADGNVRAARLTQVLVAAALIGAALVALILPAVVGPNVAIGLGDLNDILTLKGAGWVPTLSWFGLIAALIAAFAFPREERFIQAMTITLGSLAAMVTPAYTRVNLATVVPDATTIGPGLIAGWLLLGTAALLPWAGIFLWDRSKSLLGPKWWKWLFLLPASLWISVLTIFPLAYALTTSRYAYRNGRISRSVGWDNYRRLIDPETVASGLRGAVVVAVVTAAVVLLIAFVLRRLSGDEINQEARREIFGLLPVFVVPAVIVYLCATILKDPLNEQMKITFIFVAGAVLTEMVFGFAIALFMNQEIRGRGALRAVMTLPIFATPIALGYLARAIFYEEGGPINSLLATVGLPQPPWLSSPEWARVATIVADVWQWTPFVFIIALAGLQSLPQEVIEASEVDGATGWQSLRYVTLPLMAPILWFIFLLRAIDSFKVLDIPQGLTLGGPGRATEYFSLFNYRTARKFFDYGGAAAQAFLLLLIVMILVSLLWGRIRYVYEDDGIRT